MGGATPLAPHPPFKFLTEVPPSVGATKGINPADPRSAFAVPAGARGSAGFTPLVAVDPRWMAAEAGMVGHGHSRRSS